MSKNVNKPILVSIIMSIYDGDKIAYIKETIESINAQTFKNFECIIVFDGIQNKILKNNIIEDLKVVNFKNTIIDNKENNGLAYCMNIAINESKGKYIARIDADDIMLPDRLLIQTEFLDKNKEIDVVGSSIIEFNEKNNTKVVKYPLEHEAMRKCFGKRNPLAHPSAMFRYLFFKKAGVYPTSTNKDEDTMLWLKGFIHNCIFSNLEEPLTKMRVTSDFYKRRGGYSKALDDFKNRLRVIHSLSLSKLNYFYAIGRFTIQVMPSPFIKKMCYKYLR